MAFVDLYHKPSCPSVTKNSMSKVATINCIIFWDFMMFYQAFLSPQVKRCAITTYKHGIYKLPHEFAERLNTLGP